jgi:hypothetical protein
MKQLCNAFCGVLLVLALASVVPVPAFAGGYHWDSGCRCMRPDDEYTTRRYVRAPPRVVTRERVVNHTRVVRGRTRLIQENRVIVHVQPVINREVVVHRTNTVVRDVVLRRVRTINAYRVEPYTEVVDVDEPGWVRHETEYYDVRGCGRGHGYNRGCGYGGGYYRGCGYGGRYYRGCGYGSRYHRGRGLFVSARD